MVRVATQTERGPDEVIRQAVSFFGPGGLGLEVRECAESCARFEGGGGSVAVEACVADGRTEVVVDAREWEHDARRFVASI